MDNYSKEIWKDIPGFEDAYQVSSNGNIRSKDRYVSNRPSGESVRLIKGQSIHQFINNSGYSYVNISKGHRRYKHEYVHRLVADAFIPNPLKLPTINHIDGNKQNNQILNLEWNSYSDNNQHAYDHNLTHSNKNNSNMSDKIAAYNLDGTLFRTFPSMREAERQMGMANGQVSQGIIHGWHSKGFIWKKLN